MSECEYCSKKIDDDENYCQTCMDEMDFHHCKNCGYECDNDYNYCPQCGYKQEVE